MNTNSTNIQISRMEKKIIHKDLLFEVMEAVFEVHNEIEPGYSEGIYEPILSKEFKI